MVVESPAKITRELFVGIPWWDPSGGCQLAARDRRQRSPSRTLLKDDIWIHLRPHMFFCRHHAMGAISFEVISLYLAIHGAYGSLELNLIAAVHCGDDHPATSHDLDIPF